jgi:hypothetical protein
LVKNGRLIGLHHHLVSHSALSGIDGLRRTDFWMQFESFVKNSQQEVLFQIGVIVELLDVCRMDLDPERGRSMFDKSRQPSGGRQPPTDWRPGPASS